MKSSDLYLSAITNDSSAFDESVMAVVLSPFFSLPHPPHPYRSLLIIAAVCPLYSDLWEDAGKWGGFFFSRDCFRRVLDSSLHFGTERERKVP